MPNSSRWRHGLGALVLLVAAGLPSRAVGQTQAEGFAVERFYSSAPSAGWLVMDELNQQGKLGGAVALMGSYARHPLQLTRPDHADALPVVANQAFVDVGLALLFDRFRFSLNLPSPVYSKGKSGVLGTYQLTAPTVDVTRNPDAISDCRFSVDARLFGDPGGVFRLGASATLVIPSGARDSYFTDGIYRGMVRALFAGNLGQFSYAGQVGVHIRTLNDAPAPGSPQGSELLFGVAAGPQFPVSGSSYAITVGPEVFGETAFRAFFGRHTTGIEALLTGRLEDTDMAHRQFHMKVGAGGGLHSEFGAPEWRAVLALELVDRVR